MITLVIALTCDGWIRDAPDKRGSTNAVYVGIVGVQNLTRHLFGQSITPLLDAASNDTQGFVPG